MGIIFGLGITSYRAFDNRRKVEEAALDFGTTLRETQKKADSGVKPSTCLNPLIGYQISVVGSPTADAMEYTQCPPSWPLFNLLTLHYNALFMDDLSVVFLTTGRGVIVSDGVTVISDQAGSAQFKVSVDPGGAIMVEKI